MQPVFGNIIMIIIEDFDKNMNKALWGIAFDIQDSLRKKLTFEHGRDTGDLRSGISVKVIDNSIEISMPEHGKFVEFGAPPHFPPPEELEGWVSRKWGATGKDVKKKAWTLAYAISKRGTRPYPFIRTTFNNDLIPIIKDNLKEAFN